VLPGGITTITVTGSYLDALGSPAQGVVMFTPGSALTDPSGKVILAGTPVQARLSAGAFSVVLPCTDSAVLSPSPFYYTVTEAVAGVAQAPFTISLPSSLGSTVDMSALTPAPVLPAPLSGLYVISVDGQSGAVKVTQVSGVTVTGTPVAGQVLKATSATTASWQNP